MSVPPGDGGPAFPQPMAATPSREMYCSYEKHPDFGGLSMLDYFAGQALAGEMASQSAELGQWLNNADPKFLEERAEFLYRFAETMVHEKQKRQGGHQA